MTGKIIKGIAGFYYVYVENAGIVECKAKGIFRNKKIKPLVGDDVELLLLSEMDKTGSIVDILPRKNELIRPAVANVDQAMVIFASAEPEPNLNLLDRFLVMMTKQGIDTTICFNKTDLTKDARLEELKEHYCECGSSLVFVSAARQERLEMIRELLNKKTTVLAGPSGVGKSTITNLMSQQAVMQTGSISERIKRGKQTTRHSELVYLAPHTFLMDTPGFSSLYITDIEKNELKNYFLEFLPYAEECRFADCVHMEEAGCAVKAAVFESKISKARYENYRQMYKELQNQKKY